MSDNVINTCQYWIENEPVVCSHWDSATNSCSLGSQPTHGPECNRIGTETKCDFYEGEGTESRCILPDPERHVVNRRTGEKWIISDINGYNEGQCDGEGTDYTCKGYSPYHLGFSALQPDDKDGSLSLDEMGFSVISGTRLPLGYDVYNERSKLSRCYWWKDDPAIFEVDADGYIVDVVSKCSNTDETVDQFKEFEFDKDTGMYRAPCNGAKPECPFYTGVCWQYCIDDKMGQGDKVLAEQILELRYYLRRNRWTTESFAESFIEPIIYAWQGPPKGMELKYSDSGAIDNWSINAIKTEISDFDDFTLDISTVRLTEGTKDQTGLPSRPDLVRGLKDAAVTPIIRNEFDQDESGNNVFEAASLDHEKILILGDTFWYNVKTYGINLNDPELDFLPDELRYYDSMEDAKVLELYDEFYEQLDTILTNLLQYWPEKMVETEVGVDNAMFYLDMQTFWGENTIVVLNKGNGTWEFDKITVNKLFCGGVIAQDSFVLEGESGKTINYLPAYERHFNCDTNNNGSITFAFLPFTSDIGETAGVSYIYNDSVVEQIAANPYNPPAFSTYYTGYQLYKVLAYEDLELTQGSVQFFGNAGYALVIIPDDNKVLNNIIRNWEIEGDILLEVTGDDYEGIEGNSEGIRTIEMEIYEQGTDRLEVNQIIVRPKDIKEFKTPCSLSLTLSEIYVYQKRSFGETPDEYYEEVVESFVGEDDVVNYGTSLELTSFGHSQYELKKFGNNILFISVMFTGAVSGRIKGVTRTKMITWVRQPYCRDVEIRYTWTASYKHCTLLPEKVCYGQTSFECDDTTWTKGYTPSCGDHDLGAYSGTGPMWYPYDECANSAVYPTDSLTSRVMGMSDYTMELFYETNDDESLKYGSWNLRMLGPQNNYGYVCDNHAALFNCTCDWSYCNLYKESENLFNGNGKYRCGLDGMAKAECVAYGGDLPKFGNPYRDFLMSFRSIDSVYYYYVDGTDFTRLRKWMPLYEFYTSADVTKGSSSYPYDLYTKDTTSPFVHPMGLLRAYGSIEGVPIKEQLDVDNEGIPKRYDFDEVFDTNHTNSSIMYPWPVNAQFNGDDMVMSWFTYKDYPGGDTSKSIQWAWQEIWQPIEEQLFVSDIILMGESTDEEIADVVFSGGYTYENNAASGKLIFCTVEYPDYQYDAYIGEHRLVCEAGDYTISLTAPVKNSEGEYESPYFFIQLDNGPKRMFDIDGNWDSTSDDNPHYNLYTTCTVEPWATSVTLFAPGYTNDSTTQAETDGRVIETYDDIGDEVKTYYQRGLNISLIPSKFTFLPKWKMLIPSDAYEVKFNTVPSCVMGEEIEEIEVDEWYPMPYCLNIPYCCSEEEVEFEFEFIAKKSIERIVCDFKFGAETLEDESIKLHHIPAISVLKSTDGESYTLLHTHSTGMVLATEDDAVTSERVAMTWNIGPENILEPWTYLKLKFRVKPTADELDYYELINYDDCTNVVYFECNYMYDSEFIDATESVYTYERKYNISYGKHGDFPPHGYNSTGNLLYPRGNETSTVYQRDSRQGVVGMAGTSGEHETMNKVRGRLMFECHDDNEPLTGGNLPVWEEEQKKIYDAIAIEPGSTTFTCSSMCPPGLSDQLAEANVYFPYTWGCSFLNTIILPLTPVKWCDPYSPCGQLFDWDLSDYHWEYRCAGSQFGAYSVGAKEVFEYKLYSACEDSNLVWSPLDAILVYYSGVGRLLTNPFIYTEAQIATGDYLLEQSLTTYAMPSAVTAY